MNITEVSWRPAARSAGIDAKEAYDHLENVRETTGRLTDDAVVESAKPEDSVIHPYFEWDDSVAAVEFRRSQARTLVRSIQVEYKEAPKTPARAYMVSVKAPRKSEERTIYTTTEEIMKDPELRDKAIAEAIRMAMEFRRKFQHIKELSRVIEEIDNAIEALA